MSDCVTADVPAGREERIAGLQRMLSRREREVLALYLQGMNAREIGKRLFLAPNTVYTHLHSIQLKYLANGLRMERRLVVMAPGPAVESEVAR